MPISAAHGEGLVDLHDALLEAAGKLGMESVLLGDTAADDAFEDAAADQDEKFDDAPMPFDCPVPPPHIGSTGEFATTLAPSKK